jgi:hypothetical protein
LRATTVESARVFWHPSDGAGVACERTTDGRPAIVLKNYEQHKVQCACAGSTGLVEDLVVIFMTQRVPSGTFNIRSQLTSLVYSALVD